MNLEAVLVLSNFKLHIKQPSRWVIISCIL